MKSRSTLALFACITALCCACSDDAAPTAAARRRSAAAVSSDAGVAPSVEFAIRAEDLVESETHRDPFRSALALFEPKTLHAPQRSVLMPNTSIEEMRLIAVVSGIARPRAMLVDRLGIGYVVEQGNYIGRAEAVPSGSDGLTLSLNWQVDRVLAHELVLERDNPSAPDRPPLTRILPLHQDAAASTK